jgi:hypothetical protein
VPLNSRHRRRSAPCHQSQNVALETSTGRSSRHGTLPSFATQHAVPQQVASWLARLSPHRVALLPRAAAQRAVRSQELFNVSLQRVCRQAGRGAGHLHLCKGQGSGTGDSVSDAVQEKMVQGAHAGQGGGCERWTSRLSGCMREGQRCLATQLPPCTAASSPTNAQWKPKEMGPSTQFYLAAAIGRRRRQHGDAESVGGLPLRPAGDVSHLDFCAAACRGTREGRGIRFRRRKGLVRAA